MLSADKDNDIYQYIDW